MKEHEFFTKLNDAILFNFERFNLWERAFLTNLLDKVMFKEDISIKQKQRAITIIEKRSNTKPKQRSVNRDPR
ncbi:hypothetical protein R3X26_05225 [Vibrio sp. TH_r3]|uniref:hypothetical protein n=1 Tax=Vibrio sp. TH_r3 TaxID=3082084 RepID=UPI0029541683|nr:hypothetical protein [Vibrio sp. TH_r3]MDV7103809.1 hypothetical protein [Vibrio sp. TH_r3]